MKYRSLDLLTDTAARDAALDYGRLPLDRIYRALLPEADIWRSASELVQRYGHQADFQAALRAARHLIKEDIDAHATWMRIVHAIIRLQAVKRSETMH